MARYRQALPLPDKPSIAVLAFTNMSGDPEQEYFADGIAEDIITALSRSRSLFVIARNSSFTYKGQRRRCEAGRPRTRRPLRAGRQRARSRRPGPRHCAAHRCRDRQPFWAERYDRDLADVFAVQDEITTAVVTAIGPAVSEAEQQRALRKPPEASGPGRLSAGLWHWPGLRRSYARRRVSSAARSRWTRLWPPHAMLALRYITGRSRWAVGNALPRVCAQAELEARTAIDTRSRERHRTCSLAWIRARTMSRSSFGRGGRDRAQPKLPAGSRGQGRVLVFTGRTAEARDSLTTALRLDPRGPTALAAMATSSMCILLRARLRAAEGMARRTRASATRSRFDLCCGWLRRLANLGGLRKRREVLAQSDRRRARLRSNSLPERRPP